MTILKPLCGEDPGLFENLASFCGLDYLNFELICGVQDASDPAIAVVERLKAAYPECAITLVVDARPHGSNLKVANLMNMLERARHPILAIVDSDMRVPPDFLARAAGPLADPAVGLVTTLYRARPADGGIWSQLAALHINHGFLPQALVGEAVNPGVSTFGAGMLLSRATLEAAGGFAAVADTLADDNALGAAVLRLGKRIVVAPLLIDDWVTENGLAALWRHELRWAITIRGVAPWGYLGSIVTHPVALSSIGALAGAFAPATLVMLLAAVLARLAMVRAMDRALDLAPLPLWLTPLRDLLSFAVFVAAFATRTVAWRDRRYRVDRAGHLVQLDPRPQR